MEEGPVAPRTRSGKRNNENGELTVVSSPVQAKRLKLAVNEPTEDLIAMAKILSTPSKRKMKEILDNVRKIRELLAVERNPPAQQVINAGLVAPLVELLGGRYSNEIKHEAVWSLTNVAWLNSEGMVKAGILPLLVEIFQDGKGDLLEQSVWCLANVVGGSTAHRDLALKTGVLPPLVSYLEKSTTSLSLLRTIAWLVSKMCNVLPFPNLDDIESIIDPLCVLVQKDGVDEEVFSDTVWALARISGAGDAYVQRIMETGVVPFLIKQVNGRFFVASWLPLVRCLGNFVRGDEAQTQIILDAGLLFKLQHVLQATNHLIRLEGCMVLFQLINGLKKDKLHVVFETPKFLQTVVNCALNDPKPMVKKVALDVLWLIVASSNEPKNEFDRIIELAGSEHEPIKKLRDKLEAKLAATK